MPIYEYRCPQCDEVFEEIQKFSDPVLDTCRLCGAKDPKKLVSTSAFHLKGSGWYQTDYKNSGKPPSSESTDKSASSETPPSDTKTSGEPSSSGADD